jgi:predicted phage replisome organizer
MGNIKWIKINVDMFDDEKIKIIQSMPEGDALLLVWIKLILLAGKTNEGGYIYINENMPYTEDMLSVVMNKPTNVIKLALATFHTLGMIENDEKGIYLINFEKHQSLDKLEQIREQTRLRVARHRAKIKESNNVTLHVTQSNAIEEEIDKEEEKEKDIDDVLRIYEENFGTLSPTTTETLIKLEEDYTSQYVREALKRSILANKKSLAYVKGILKQWKEKNWDEVLNEGNKKPQWMDKEIKKEVASEEELEDLENMMKEFK